MGRTYYYYIFVFDIRSFDQCKDYFAPRKSKYHSVWQQEMWNWCTIVPPNTCAWEQQERNKTNNRVRRYREEWIGIQKKVQGARKTRSAGGLTVAAETRVNQFIYEVSYCLFWTLSVKYMIFGKDYLNWRNIIELLNIYLEKIYCTKISESAYKLRRKAADKVFYYLIFSISFTLYVKKT